MFEDIVWEIFDMIHSTDSIEKFEKILNFFQVEALHRSFAARKVIVKKNCVPFWHQTWLKNK
jgi:hypothetical protein